MGREIAVLRTLGGVQVHVSMEGHSESRAPAVTALSVHRAGQGKSWPSVGVGPEEHGAYTSWPQWPRSGLVGARFGQKAKGKAPPRPLTARVAL